MMSTGDLLYTFKIVTWNVFIDVAKMKIYRLLENANALNTADLLLVGILSLKKYQRREQAIVLLQKRHQSIQAVSSVPLQIA